MSSWEPGVSEQGRRSRRRRELLGALKTTNAAVADLEWALAELEQQIAALEAELAASGEGAVERRLRDLRRWRGALEERALRQMYRAEELSAALEAAGGR